MLQTSQEVRGAEAGNAVRAQEKIYAALDLGTNNCRLLIATAQPPQDGVGPAIRVFDSFSRIVRLGEGVSTTGVLSEDAMERTLVALKACQKKLDKYQLDGMRFVATEACRRASNGRTFLDMVQSETGLAIDIISSEEEARLAFAGCSSLLTDATRRAIVFDIGGGSTELMWIDRHSDKPISDWLSVGFGVMNLADKFGGSSFMDMAFDDMVKFVCSRLQGFDDTNSIGETIDPAEGGIQLLSTSGTVTTLAAIHLGLPRYDRSRIDGITLAVPDIRATISRLREMRPSERFNHPCIGLDRADFIISGCAIFEAITSLWPASNITIADRGVREGIILSLMKAEK